MMFHALLHAARTLNTFDFFTRFFVFLDVHQNLFIRRVFRIDKWPRIIVQYIFIRNNCHTQIMCIVCFFFFQHYRSFTNVLLHPY